ncbi:penicillin-binding transpeptidase domain-containing protein [Pelagicoccus sp. SDUM812005]|uniref:penicillin-binding transpeptidase domain-containing protein n=1 Tax=Pelagicoccus sp. SDUM812005 TaxID=3041257 RepID=UPI00280E93E5|nr:penicillin-binding transpeptidase domain-containing protein [Pelagicoccus sp. SDUM812005]MDQ8181784.1 penicillin-binding transpeptidase domain-containing protein [Pelagicoccus sp. SDUM812005]
MKHLLACLGFLAFVNLHAATEPIAKRPDAQALLDESGYRGTLLIYDLAQDTYFASHPDIADERFIPASTFKILSTQVALQTGVVPHADTRLKWDGIERGRRETNRDLDFRDAFRISSVPHYQAIVKEIGAERMQAALDSIPYGNQDISGGITQFWLTGALRISPREQIEFLRKLYQNELPFSSHAMESVKSMMRSPSEGDTTYHAKTGWAVLPENRNIGWWGGWAEKEGRILFFATVLDSSSPGEDFGSARIELTKAALQKIFPEQ